MVRIGASNLTNQGNRLGFLIVPQRADEKGRKRHCSQQRNIDLRFPTQAIEYRMESMSRAVSAAPAPLILTSGATSRLNALLSLRALRALFLLLNMFFLLLLTPLQRGAARFASSASPQSSRCSMEKAKAGEDSSRQRKRKSGLPIVVRVPAAMATRRAGGPRDSEVALRRAMAIRRVAVEEEGLGRGRSKDFSLFVTTRGDTLFTRSWTPIDSPIKGLVLILHGLNEHSGRYDSFARRLNESGFKVYAMDWTGHGGSDGLHGYVHSLDYAVADTKSFLGKIQEENAGLPCFCFGHSTGGAIVLKAALDVDVAARLHGVVLTSPAIQVQPAHPILAIVAPIISLLMPRYQLRSAEKKDVAVSRDPAAVAAKYSDPLVFTGALRVRTGYEILRITTYLQENLERVSVPFMALHGSADTITEPAATRRLHEAARSEDKSLKIYSGLLHDLLFEPEGEEIAEDIVAWMGARVH